MNATEEGENHQELNFIFKTLGERQRTDEAKRWKKHSEHLLPSLLQTLQEDYGNRLNFRICGSTAEDLKCYEPDVGGDVDIMIFPDHLVIHNEMIEYLPEHPTHARIKGADHPVLQSCLAEDTEYVATSALINFNPIIYGDFAFKIGQVMPQEDSHSFLTLPRCNRPALEKNKTSPAIAVNVYFAQSRKARRLCDMTTDILSSLEVYQENDNTESIPDSEGVDDKSDTDVDPHESKEGSAKTAQQSQKREFTSYDVPHNQYPDKEKEKEENINRHYYFFEHLFLKGTETKGDSVNEKNFEGAEKAEQIHQRVLSPVDFVPAFRCHGWPKIAREWIKRERKWPSPDIVNRVIQEGFHLVVKPPKNGGNPDCDFRISFSHAEYLLSQEMNDIQRECYRCLKKFFRAYLSTESQSLVTFHLKNILLQTIEETGTKMWIESSRAACMIKLLGNLLEALRKKDLRHFFVRSYNLFCADYIECPEILESLAGRVAEIMENPMHYAKKLILKQDSKSTRQIMKEEYVPSNVLTFSESFSLSNQISEDDLSLSPVLATNVCRCLSSSKPSCQYHYLKNKFITTAIDLYNMAFHNSDYRLEFLDPLERSLVEDLRDLTRDQSILANEIRELEIFLITCEKSWHSFAYLSVKYNTEQNITIRHRMLVAIKGIVEIFKYAMKHKNWARGNQKAIFRKMFDPMDEDRLDLSLVFPSGIGWRFLLDDWDIFWNTVIAMVLHILQPQQLHLEDIPLD